MLTYAIVKGTAGVEGGVEQGVACERVPQGSMTLEQVEPHSVEMTGNSDERLLNLYVTNQTSVPTRNNKKTGGEAL